MKRILVVGFDGATLDIAEPMMREGKLPNLSNIREEGVSGTLFSSIPPNSSVAWSSFMTGMKPGGHGVYYFRERKADTYYRPFITFNSIRAKSLWRILSDHGKKVAVVNVPLTYPPEQVNGFLVGGLLTPSKESVFTYPPDLHLELIRALGDYPLDSESEKIFWGGDEMGAFTHMLYATRKILEASLYLMGKLDWNFFMTVFRSIDLVQHRAWRFRVPEYRERYPVESEKYGRIIEMCYEMLDEYLGTIMSETGEDVTVIIMSDHGCGPIEGRFYVNRWLLDNGYLRLKPGSSLKARMIGIEGDHLGEGRIMRSPLKSLSRRCIRFLKPQLFNESTDRVYLSMIDWSRTKAFSSLSGGEEIIIINMRGREPQGIVEPGDEYERLRDELIKGLEELQDSNGRKIIDRAYKREELYEGPYLRLAPDIQFLTRDLSILPRGDFFVDGLYRETSEHTPALHRRNGILFMKGQGIKKAASINDARIEDLAPTIIHMYGMPVPEEMDGKVLIDCFSDDFKASHVLSYEKADSGSVETGDEKGYSPGEEEEIRKTLQGLGYLS